MKLTRKIESRLENKSRLPSVLEHSPHGRYTWFLICCGVVFWAHFWSKFSLKSGFFLLQNLCSKTTKNNPNFTCEHFFGLQLNVGPLIAVISNNAVGNDEEEDGNAENTTSLFVIYIKFICALLCNQNYSTKVFCCKFKSDLFLFYNFF